MVALTTVLTILVPVLCGYFLARRQILHDAALEDLSRLLINFLVPCLIFTSVASGVGELDWRSGALLIFVSPLYTGAGLLLGWGLVRLFPVAESERRPVAACIGFANAGYIPFGLVPALVPEVGMFGDPQAATTRGLVYVAMFLFFWTPLMWSVGLNLFRDSREKDQGGRWTRWISPPFVAVLAGMAVGAGPVEALLAGPGAPLSWLHEGLRWLGSTATPLVMLVLGGTLAEIHWAGQVRLAPVIAVVLARSILMPLLVFGAAAAAVQRWGPPSDSLALFVLLLQGAMPPATNLAVVARRYNCHPQLISGILLVSYLVALLSIPIWLTLFLRWLERW